MNRLIIVSLLSLGIGIAAAGAFLSNAKRDASIPLEKPTSDPVSFDSTTPIEERLAALEQALSVERQARQLLQEEVLVLNGAIDELTGADETAGALAEPEVRPAAERVRRSPDDDERLLRRTERLIDAGFTAAEAEWILRRESELQMQALQARYDARRAGEPVNYFGGRTTDALRQELGDAGYERYLEASGRPTRVAISTVFEGSPALAAGLRPGDQIVSYDGRRVFNMDDITALTMEGEAGQSVVIDITRDGIPMQMTIPRGPLGVIGGRRFRR